MTEPKPRKKIQLSFALHFCIIAISILVGSCKNGVKNGELIFTEARPESGFNFPYFLFIPDDMNHEEELVLIVSPTIQVLLVMTLKSILKKPNELPVLNFTPEIMWPGN